MKKTLLFAACLFLLGNLAMAQVIEDFSKAGSTGIYALNKWGSPGSIDSIYQVADPVGVNKGALAIAIDFKGVLDKDAIGFASATKGKISSKGAQFLTLWIFIDTTTGKTLPDSISFQLYYQPSAGWAWTSTEHYAKDIPKGHWFPLSMNIKELSISDPTGHGLTGTNDVGDFGVQIYNAGDSQTATFKGVVYVTNVSLVGVSPTPVQSFSTGLGKFKIGWSNGWTDSLYWAAGPIGGVNGALAFNLKSGTASTGTAYAADVDDGGSINASGQNFLVCWVYADTTLPDSAKLIVYAQDRSSWTDPAPMYPPTYYGKDIPKGKWYPIYFDIAQATILDSAKFNPWKNHFGWYGLMLGGRTVDSNITVYVSKMEMINAYVPPANVPGTWIISDFASTFHGWYVPPYASGSVTRYLDIVTANPGYHLQGSVAISPTAKLFAAVRDSVKMQNKAGDSIATDLYCDIYLPSKMPAKGVVKFFVSNGKSDSVAVTDTIGSQINTVLWSTLHIAKLDSLAQKGKFDPTKKHRIGVAIYYPGSLDTTTWTGKIEIGNVSLVGFADTVVFVSVKQTSNVARQFALYDNYPNPFNPSTLIRFDMAKESKVQIKIYDILGKEIATLVDGVKSAGSYEVEFNASKFASGIYFAKMITADYHHIQKMMLIK